MKNESVGHVRYGIGRVAEAIQSRVVVLFDGEARRKVFVYPDAFERFLCSGDPILQGRAEAAVMELREKRTEEMKQRFVVYQLYGAERKQEQTESLKKRRKAARERLTEEKMAKVIQKGIRDKDESKEESKNGRRTESTAGREVKRKVLEKGVG